MFRRLLRELLPNQRKAEVLKQDEPSGATPAIRSFQQRVKLADKHRKLPESSEKQELDRTDDGQRPA